MSVTNTYRNPILPGFNPDPSICYVPGKGYFVAVSSFEYFPGLPIYHSTDLVNWKLIGHALNRRSQGVDMRSVESSAGLWAPTFRYFNGKWYMICSCFWRIRFDAATTGAEPEMISSGFYVSTDDIFDDSKWSDAVYFEEIGFDQDLLFDDDGRVYHTVTRFDFDKTKGTPDRPFVIQSWINEIDLASGRSLTEPVLAKASSLGTAEGCHILKRDGWYYFFTAEGGTESGHRECVYRSKSPMGPFEAPPDGVNPLIYNADHPDIQNTGHMDLIEGDDGKWVAVFLGVRPVFEATSIFMPTQLGRETFMAPMEWVDGWPVVNKRKQIELIGEGDGLTLLPEVSGWIDEFKEPTLALGWYSVRVPFQPCYSLSERPGYLAIRGSPCKITVEHAPAILLQKQKGFDLDWSTQVEFTPSKPGQEAGTVVWLSKDTHASLAVRGIDGGKTEIVFKKPGSEEKTFPMSAAPGTPVTLSINARKLSYSFSFQIEGDERVQVTTFPSSDIKPVFTGVHIGLYAQGANDTPCLNSAFFKYAKWDLPAE